MAAVIQVHGDTATFNFGKWSSKNQYLSTLLNSTIRDDWNTPDKPNPIMQEAKRAMRLCGGIILHVDAEPSKPNVIY